MSGTLSLSVLPEPLRQAAALIDEQHRFTALDETQLQALADHVENAFLPQLGECREAVSDAKQLVPQAAAGAFEDGLRNGASTSLAKLEEARERASEFASGLRAKADELHDVKARFFEIVVIYWQRAQFYGCKNPASLDALLASNTVSILEEARAAWGGLVEQHV